MSTPTCIAVGFDGSSDSEAALRWAASLASALGATLKVVHAVGLLEHAGLSPLVAHERRARSIAADEGVDAANLEWCVFDGDPGSVLSRSAQGEHAAELLVVGTRGTGAHPGTLLGSTSLGLVERAPVPVVVVPAPSGNVTRLRAPDGSPPA